MLDKDLYIAVAIDPDKEQPVLEIRQHNVVTEVGSFISEDHAKLFVEALNLILNKQDDTNN